MTSYYYECGISECGKPKPPPPPPPFKGLVWLLLLFIGGGGGALSASLAYHTSPIEDCLVALKKRIACVLFRALEVSKVEAKGAYLNIVGSNYLGSNRAPASDVSSVILCGKIELPHVFVDFPRQPDFVQALYSRRQAEQINWRGNYHACL